MARKYAMTWQASTRRWFKKHRGKMHTVSCRQLGSRETKEEKRCGGERMVGGEAQRNRSGSAY